MKAVLTLLFVSIFCSFAFAEETNHITMLDGIVVQVSPDTCQGATNNQLVAACNKLGISIKPSEKKKKEAPSK